MRSGILKLAVRNVMGHLGFEIIHKFPDWRELKTREKPTTIIDVGCAYGTPELYDAFPDAALLLIDPLQEYLPYMRNILKVRRGSLEIIGVGSREDHVNINIPKRNLTKSSVFSRTPLTSVDDDVEIRDVAISTIDRLVDVHEISPPFGLKIDTEGFEMEVLRGAEKCLSQCAFVIAECSVQKRFHGSYSLDEVIGFLADRGLVPERILTARPDRYGQVRYLDILFEPRKAT